MAKSAFAIAYKAIETANCVVGGSTPVTVGLSVGFNGQVVSTRSVMPWGIAQFDAALGQAVALVTAGEAVAKVGAAITAKDTPLTTDASGRLIPAISTDTVFARSMGTATAANDFVLIQITREGRISF